MTRSFDAAASSVLCGVLWAPIQADVGQGGALAATVLEHLETYLFVFCAGPRDVS